MGEIANAGSNVLSKVLAVDHLMREDATDKTNVVKLALLKQMVNVHKQFVCLRLVQRVV